MDAHIEIPIARDRFHTRWLVALTVIALAALATAAVAIFR